MPKKSSATSTKKSTKDDKRSFVSISKDGDETGRYINKSPSAAAIKAAKSLLTRNKKQAVVTVRESTQGSGKKQFSYTVKKEKITMDDKDAKKLEKKIGFVPKFKYSAKKK
jgi:hypothetical protein